MDPRPELPVVPGHHPGHVHLDDHPLVEHRLHEGLQLVGVGPVVALEEIDPEAPHPLGVLHDLGRPHQLHPPELLVVVAVLHQTGDPRVPPQVLHLLGLGLRLEGHRPLEEPVPHGHGVDRAVVVDGAQRHGLPFVEELVDLRLGHLDDVALLDPVTHPRHRPARSPSARLAHRRRGRSVQGRCLIPLMKLDRSRSGSADGPDVGQVLEQLPAHHRDLPLGQVGAQAEVGPGRPEPDVGVGRPGHVEASGFSKMSSSRLAEL